jgi:hypothetical protein
MYDELHSRAIDKKLQSGETARVFTGSYVDAWKATGIAQSYYTPIRRALEAHGAITILQRGGRNVDTVIVLIGLPDVWEDIPGGLTDGPKYASLNATVKDIERRLGGMNVAAALQEIEMRLTEVEVLTKKLSREMYETRNHIKATAIISKEN